jgi:tetratricopeptide (TPR) repeat protein
LSRFDRAIALCLDAERPLAAGLGKDYWVHALSDRSLALWTLGYPDTALAAVRRAVKDARDLGRGLGSVVGITSMVCILCGNYAAANAQLDEALAWADEKSSAFWKAFVTRPKGWVLALIGKTSDAVEMITSGIAAIRSTGSTVFIPTYLSELAAAYADIGQFDDAWRCIDEAMVAIETTKETWFEAETNRIAGQIALLSPEPNAAKAQTYFERALQTARQQQAKSWELRAAMSMARLWRDQGKLQQARELLASVYSWFTEGFDTRDLKEAKVLLDALSS